MAMEAPAWETSKENVQPLKVGRRVRNIEEARSKDQGTLQEEERELLQEIESSKDLEDPLNSWLKYIKWARANFPTNSSKTLEILELCTNSLKNVDAYRNDPRYVKVWIEYADMLQTPGEVFTFMQVNKIGIKVSLYWIAWAFVVEKLGNFAMTDKIFQKGLRMQAEPKDLLQKRYQQFQRRLARHYLNLSEAGDSADAPGEDRSKEKQRSALKQLDHGRSQQSAGLPQQKRVTSESKTSIKRDNFTVYSENAVSVSSTNSEAALSDGARESWTTFAPEKVQCKENTGVTSKWNEGPLRANNISSRDGGLRTQQNITATEIFVDPEFMTSETDSQQRYTKDKGDAAKGLSIRKRLEQGEDVIGSRTAEMIHRNPLALHKMKEETERTEKDILHVPKSEESVPNASGFSIFSDSDAAPSGEKSSRKETSIKSSKPKEATVAGGFSIFTDSDAAPSRKETSIKSSKPKEATVAGGFSIFSDSDAAPSGEKSSRKETSIKSSKPKEATVAGGFSIFSDSDAALSGEKSSRKETSIKSSKPKEATVAGGFSIFTDSDAAPSRKETSIKSSKPKEATVAGGFSIFTDSDAAPSGEKFSRKETSIKSSKPKEATVAGGFSIFSDSDAALSGEKSSRKETSIKSSKPKEATVAGGFSIFPDNHSSAVDSEEENEKLCAEFEILSGENETINTKLAKMDIDQMFFEEPMNFVDKNSENCGAINGNALECMSPLPQTADNNGSCLHLMDDSSLNFEPTRDFTNGNTHEKMLKECGRDGDTYFRYSSCSSSSKRSKSNRSSDGSTGSREEHNSLFISPASDCSRSRLHGRPLYDGGRGCAVEVIRDGSDNESEIGLNDLCNVDCSRRNNKTTWKPDEEKLTQCGMSNAEYTISSSSVTKKRLITPNEKHEPHTQLLYTTTPPNKRQRQCVGNILDSLQLLQSLQNKHSSSTRYGGNSHKRKTNTLASVNPSTYSVYLELHVDINNSIEDIFANLIKISSSHMTIEDCRDLNLPIALGGKRKAPTLCNTTDCTRFHVGSDIYAGPRTFIGKGSFGYAVKCYGRSSALSQQNGFLSTPQNQSIVIKVDHRKKFVLWEAIIHSMIRSGIENLLKTENTQNNNFSFDNYYRKHFLPPFSVKVFNNASTMTMGYANMGSLLDLVSAVQRHQHSFSAHELEHIAMYFVQQMLQALKIIHSVNILHGDIKEDNWVLSCSDVIGKPVICLIDFGLSKLLPAGGIDTPLREDNFAKDYRGVASCAHYLQYFGPIKTSHETIQNTMRRGFVAASSLYQNQNTQCTICIPQVTLKRYWSREIWSQLYILMLNSSCSRKSLFQHLWSELDNLNMEMSKYLRSMAEDQQRKLFEKVSRILESIRLKDRTSVQ